jgi:hypothetical protein
VAGRDPSLTKSKSAIAIAREVGALSKVQREARPPQSGPPFGGIQVGHPAVCLSETAQSAPRGVRQDPRRIRVTEFGSRLVRARHPAASRHWMVPISRILLGPRNDCSSVRFRKRNRRVRSEALPCSEEMQSTISLGPTPHSRRLSEMLLDANSRPPRAHVDQRGRLAAGCPARVASRWTRIGGQEPPTLVPQNRPIGLLRLTLSYSGPPSCQANRLPSAGWRSTVHHTKRCASKLNAECPVIQQYWGNGRYLT